MPGGVRRRVLLSEGPHAQLGTEFRAPNRAEGIAMESDDMFVGHCVTAYGTLADGVTVANMEG